MLFHIRVGAAAFGQITHLIDAHCCGTNAYMKEHFEEFGPAGAVYTTNQTAGRGRLGRTWVNAEGKALYYTCLLYTSRCV